MKQITVNVPDELLLLLGLKEKDLAKELLKRFALTLFAENRVSLGKAVEISGIPYADFMELLTEYGLGISYEKEDLDADLRALEEAEEVWKKS